MVALSDGNISVEYMYAFISREEKTAYVILRVDDIEKAIEVIRQNNIPLLTESEIINGK